VREPVLTPLGFGGAPAGNLYRVVSDAEVADAVEAAWQVGIRYFDTAPHYGLGLSERRIGAALEGRARAGFTVSTKVGRVLVPSPGTVGEPDPAGFLVSATHHRVWDFSRDGVLRSLEGSLARLDLDRIDVVYLHDPDEHEEQARRDALPALLELRDQGRDRRGRARHEPDGDAGAVRRECDVDLVMCAGRYTLLDQGGARRPAAGGAAATASGSSSPGVYNSGLLATDRRDSAPRSTTHRRPPRSWRGRTGSPTCAPSTG
jgi:D-threo-aldose 1-dehydrogenase